MECTCSNGRKKTSSRRKTLRLIISGEGCATDPNKTKIIENYPRPNTVRDIRAFLGLCGFYRKFVPKFSELSSPLTHLTKKNVPFVWTEEIDTAFNLLKKALISPPILKYPDLKNHTNNRCKLSGN